MEDFERPDEERMLATSTGFAFCRFASVSRRAFGEVPGASPSDAGMGGMVPLVEVDDADEEEDGPMVTFGLGSFIVPPAEPPDPSRNGTSSYGFAFL